MTQQAGHFAIIAGVVAAAAMSISGTLASPRSEGAQPGESVINVPSPEIGEQPRSGSAPRPLRDLQAIKRLQVPLANLPRNPFHIGAAPPAATPSSEATRGQLLSALQGLRLESILRTETTRACAINGKALAEGDACGNFTIEKINSASVALKSGIYRFELRVQQ